MNDLLKQLKPCKRCGYQHAEYVVTPHSMFMVLTHHIYCKQCGYRTKEKKTLEQACDVWNMPLRQITDLEWMDRMMKKPMKIYIVELHDYDRNESVGYFTDADQAQDCCRYQNIINPSEYSDDNYKWEVVEYDLNTIDYGTLIKEYEAWENRIINETLERNKQEELAKLEELKAKYEEPKVAKWTLHNDGSGTCSHCHFTQKAVYDQDNFNRFCSVCGYEMSI